MKYQQKIGDSRVIESRESADGMSIRRRRETLDGKHRFTTYERLERPHLTVFKKDGKYESFERDKLLGAIKKAVGKFFSSDMEVETLVNEIEEQLYSLGESEVTSRQIGDIVMEQLGKKNAVAYVRFASVYREFKTLDDFAKILKEQHEKSEKEAA